MLRTARRHWFLFSLLSLVVVGMWGAARLEPVADALPRDWIVGGVLFLMALPLRTDAVWQALRRPTAVLLAIAVNMAVVPLLAWVASSLLIEDLALGLIVAAAVPSTLASAAVWTRLAGGDDVVSLMVTVVTNLACFAVTPATIHLVGQESELDIPFSAMVAKLFVLVLVPLVAGQLLRLFPAVARGAEASKSAISLLSQLGLLSIVFCGAVQCGLRLEALPNGVSGVVLQIGLMCVLASVVHFVAWLAGFSAAGMVGLSRGEQIAVGFSGSQKTLMVGLAIAAQFGGLAVLPMVAYHIEQLVIDTLLANWLKARDKGGG